VVLLKQKGVFLFERQVLILLVLARITICIRSKLLDAILEHITKYKRKTNFI
jgi:hypothetical protein